MATTQIITNPILEQTSSKIASQNGLTAMAFFTFLLVPSKSLRQNSLHGSWSRFWNRFFIEFLHFVSTVWYLLCSLFRCLPGTFAPPPVPSQQASAVISAFNFSSHPQTMHSIMHALPHVCMQAVAKVGLEGGAAMIRRRRLQYIYTCIYIYVWVY